MSSWVESLVAENPLRRHWYVVSYWGALLIAQGTMFLLGWFFLGNEVMPYDIYGTATLFVDAWVWALAVIAVGLGISWGAHKGRRPRAVIVFSFLGVFLHAILAIYALPAPYGWFISGFVLTSHGPLCAATGVIGLFSIKMFKGLS